MHLRQGIQATFVFFFSENVFYPTQSFFCLEFSQLSYRGFDNVLERVFLNFVFYTIHNYYFANFNTRLVRSQPSKFLVFSRFSGLKVS